VSPRNVAIFVFDDVEVLDFAGPYEVFNVASELTRPQPFYVYNVGLSHHSVLGRGKFQVTPRYSVDDCPQPDILVVPGGSGTRPLLKHERLLQWLAAQASRVELLLSVCTGALLLAKAGLLENRDATTHRSAFDQLRELSPSTRVVADERFVQSAEKIFTAAGISAGIDLSLHIVERLLGPEARQSVTTEMEYRM